MEDKRLKQFTFYDLYYEALKGLPDEAAGRMAKNICRFMFTNEEIPEPQDDRENFFWSNIKDVLEEVKRIEESGRKPKNFNEKMPHFMFMETYYKAIKLMTDAESGQYIKAICEYMFFGTVHCEFDSGRSLGLIDGEDDFRALTAQELAEDETAQGEDTSPVLTM